MRYLASLMFLLMPSWLLAQPAGKPEITYPQLISTRYASGAALPDGAQRPPALYRFVDTTKLPADAKLLSAAKSASGAIWVVTDKGAFRSEGDGYVPLVKPAKARELNEPPLPKDLAVVAVAADRLGHIWAATSKGLLVSDGQAWWQMITGKDGVPFEAMTCLELAANGDVWGGTTEGAWRLRNGQFRYFWGQRWLPGNMVKAI